MLLANVAAGWSPELVAAAAGVAGLIVGMLVGWLVKPSAAAKPDAGPPKPTGEPLRALALLQREGRLVDFLLEDVREYTDAQIGAAVRNIHRQCKAALAEHITLTRILPGEEGEPATVPPGFDPSAIRLTGNVTGQPPFQGTLRHHGWRASKLKLADPPAGADPFVVQPAEVELA